MEEIKKDGGAPMNSTVSVEEFNKSISELNKSIASIVAPKPNAIKSQNDLIQHYTKSGDKVGA